MSRINKPLMITMPPDELDRLRGFSGELGRPVSWVVRDAVHAYMDTLADDAQALAAVRKVNLGAIGKTKQTRRGRPVAYKKA